MEYLGVILTCRIDEIYKANNVKVDKEIRYDLDRWAVLPLDMGSRIETIKMNILPHILYLFQVLPIEIPEKQFRTWDKIISRYIWNGHRPRVTF